MLLTLYIWKKLNEKINLFIQWILVLKKTNSSRYWKKTPGRKFESLPLSNSIQPLFANFIELHILIVVYWNSKVIHQSTSLSLQGGVRQGPSNGPFYLFNRQQLLLHQEIIFFCAFKKGLIFCNIHSYSSLIYRVINGGWYLRRLRIMSTKFHKYTKNS